MKFTNTDRVNRQVNYEVHLHVWRQVDDHVYRQVSKQVEDQVYDQVKGKFNPIKTKIKQEINK